MQFAELIRKAQSRTYPGLEKEKESIWEGPFFFIQGADTQFGMTDTFQEIRKNTWDEEIQLTRKAIKLINSMVPKPRFFIICGDLVDAMPGTKYREAQEKDVVNVFNEMPSEVPLVCVCGNHDLGDRPSPYSVQNYKDKFGDDYFTFYCSGVMFIVLNSQFFQDPTLVEDLAKEQEVWLDQQLNEAKSGNYKHVIVFQHIPWFLQDPNEEKEYFNILPELREKMLQKFYNANVKTELSIFKDHIIGIGEVDKQLSALHSTITELEENVSEDSEQTYEQLKTKVNDVYKRHFEEQDTFHDIEGIVDDIENFIEKWEETAENMEGDDIVVVESSKDYRDPLTKQVIQNPLRSQVCGHSYEKSSILTYIQKVQKCPHSGCVKPLTREDLVEDLQMRRELRNMSQNTSKVSRISELDIN